MDAFGSCMDGDAPVQAIKAETAQGAAAGVTSTPTLAINGVFQQAWRHADGGQLLGPGLRTLIAAELAKVSPAPGASASPAP